MVWLTWRQHRAQAIVTVVVIAGVAFLLATDAMPTDIVKTMPMVPVLVGLFWGVPLLAREYERGTDRLVWTQSVPRFRWLMVKFAVLGVAVTVCGLGFGLVVARWAGEADDPPYARFDRFSGEVFGVTGVAAGAWFLAMFAVGAASGAVLRRLIPAMAATIGVFVAVLFGVYAARDHYAEPEMAVTSEDGTLTVPPGALLGDFGTVGPAGDLVSWDEAALRCEGREAVSCMRAQGYVRQYALYQPPERYWRFQWTEAGVLLLLSVALAGVTAHRVTRGAR